MIKVRIFETDKVIEVTKNIAHDLIDTGKAELYSGRRVVAEMPQNEPIPSSYLHRQMKPQFRGRMNVKTK